MGYPIQDREAPTADVMAEQRRKNLAICGLLPDKEPQAKTPPLWTSDNLLPGRLDVVDE